MNVRELYTHLQLSEGGEVQPMEVIAKLKPLLMRQENDARTKHDLDDSELSKKEQKKRKKEEEERKKGSRSSLCHSKWGHAITIKSRAPAMISAQAPAIEEIVSSFIKN